MLTSFKKTFWSERSRSRNRKRKTKSKKRRRDLLVLWWPWQVLDLLLSSVSKHDFELLLLFHCSTTSLSWRSAEYSEVLENFTSVYGFLVLEKKRNSWSDLMFVYASGFMVLWWCLIIKVWHDLPIFMGFWCLIIKTGMIYFLLWYRLMEFDAWYSQSMACFTDIDASVYELLPFDK